MSRSIGRYVVDLLKANGIDTVFGIPGVHNLELYRGLAASDIRHVLVRHEQGAGFAADGYARLTGHAAAAFTISGPGLTNILTAAAHALDGAVDHRSRRVEIGIADAENDDIFAAVLRGPRRVMGFPGIGAVACDALHEIRVLHPPTFCMTLRHCLLFVAAHAILARFFSERSTRRSPCRAASVGT